MTIQNNNQVIANADLSITVKAHGAELSSIQHNGTEYLWQADPAFWKRHSPVLFPIVGSVWNGTFRVDGMEYQLSQHGFARDMDFTLISATQDEVWYQLKSNEETLKKYPYSFDLNIGYKIEGKKIHVMWRVSNPGHSILDFQIGAHPAFYYRCNADSQTKGYFLLEGKKELQTIRIVEKGCADTVQHYPLYTDAEGLLPIDKDTFIYDALILEDSQLKAVTLLDSQKSPYLKLTFDTPVVGLWAPSPQSPFVCIEPWYGRCDRAHFDGEYKDKDWMQHLASGATFEGGYTIEII